MNSSEFVCIEIAAVIEKYHFCRKLHRHPKPLSRSQITSLWISQKRRIIFLYLFRASDEGIRLCKLRAGRVSRVPSDKTLFRRWSVRSPSRSAVANIRGERYDTILIKTLPLAFCRTIVSVIASLRREKVIRERLNNQVEPASRNASKWWLEDTHVRFFCLFITASADRILFRFRYRTYSR